MRIVVNVQVCFVWLLVMDSFCAHFYTARRRVMACRLTSNFLVLVITTFLIGKHVAASTGCITSVCDMRYEIASEVHALLNYKTCDDVFRLDCICNRTIDIQFLNHPPYIYTDAKTGKVVGLLTGVLHEALSVCCYSCTTIRFLKPYVTTADGVALYTSSTMMMPFVTAATSKLTVGDIFVGAIPTKGVIYITNEDVSMVHFNRFATSISSNWPLFCISLLLAIDAGIIVWLLDCTKNNDEFPKDFRQGILEGLWWAYVSMTTVGYGDKTPKSLVARLFGILWITVGVSLSGIFTASLITGMTQSLNDGNLSIEGKTVGVLNATRYELTIGTREGANVEGYSTYAELVNALIEKKIDGILMDVLVAKHYWNEMKKEIPYFYYRINAIENSKTSFGFLFSSSERNTTNREMGKYLEKFFDENKDNIDVIVKKSYKYLTKELVQGIESKDKFGESIFNSPEIYKLLFKYIGISTLFLVVLGFAFEKIRGWCSQNMKNYKGRTANHIEPEYGDMKRNGDWTSNVDFTTKVLREKFQRLMTELEMNGNHAARDIRSKVLSTVFNYNEVIPSNTIQLDDLNSKSEI